MTEGHRFAFAAAGRAIDHGARDRCCGADRHGGGTHHRVVQLAHRQCARMQIDGRGRNGLAAG